MEEKAADLQLTSFPIKLLITDTQSYIVHNAQRTLNKTVGNMGLAHLTLFLTVTSFLLKVYKINQNTNPTKGQTSRLIMRSHEASDRNMGSLVLLCCTCLWFWRWLSDRQTASTGTWPIEDLFVITCIYHRILVLTFQSCNRYRSLH